MLTPEDRETLQHYREVMTELRDTEIVKTGAAYSVTLGSQERAANDLPSETALRDLFTAFRHLWLTKEPAHFLKVCKRLRRTASLTVEESNVLEEARAHWKRKCEHNAVVMKFGSKTFTPREYIDMYFNSLYFHRGDLPRRTLRLKLEAEIGAPLGRAWLLDFVFALVEAAAVVEQIVVNVLEREAATP